MVLSALPSVVLSHNSYCACIYFYNNNKSGDFVHVGLICVLGAVLCEREQIKVAVRRVLVP